MLLLVGQVYMQRDSAMVVFYDLVVVHVTLHGCVPSSVPSLPVCSNATPQPRTRKWREPAACGAEAQLPALRLRSCSALAVLIEGLRTHLLSVTCPPCTFILRIESKVLSNPSLSLGMGIPWWGLPLYILSFFFSLQSLLSPIQPLQDVPKLIMSWTGATCLLSLSSCAQGKASILALEYLAENCAKLCFQPEKHTCLVSYSCTTFYLSWIKCNWNRIFINWLVSASKKNTLLLACNTAHCFCISLIKHLN